VHEALLTAIGKPVHTLEREWGHCQQVAALYNQVEFPPIGLEVDLTFSQVRYAHEQMPNREYAIVFDRTGKLAAALEKTSRRKAEETIGAELAAQMNGYPFLTHDALKAYEREEDFQLQSLLEEMRKAIFFAAGARFGGQVYGAKRAQYFLTAEEHQLIDESYQHPTKDTIRRLNDLYVRYLNELKSNDAVGKGIDSLSRVLKGIV
jgi:hypothetical protein